MIKSYAFFKGKYALVWLAIGLLAGLVLAMTVASPGSAKAGEHTTGLETVVASPIKVDFEALKSRSKQEIWIYGSGFAPGIELNLFLSVKGVLYDINPLVGKQRRDGGGSVWPLVTNEFGTWATNYRLGRLTRRNVGAESMATILVTDAAFNDLATTPLALCNTTGRADFAAANPDAVEVALQGLGKAITKALEADPAAKVAVHDAGNSTSPARDTVIEILAANAGATVAHINDYGKDDLADVIPDVTFIVVPEWCSASTIGEKDKIRSAI